MPDHTEWYQHQLTRALKEGSVKVEASVLTMHGAPGTGKSSLQDLILDRPPLPVRHSTPLAVNPVRAMAGEKVLVTSQRKDTCSSWVSVGPDKLMDILAKAVKSLNSKPPSSSTSRSPLPQSTLASPISLETANPREACNSFRFEKWVEQVSKATPLHQSGSPATSEVPMSLETLEAGAHFDSSATARRLLDLLMSTSAKSEQQLKVRWVYIIDSGGQPQFQDILPLFVRKNMLNIVTFRLSQKLDDKPQFEWVHHGKHLCQPTDLQLTNLELIESLLRSLCTFQQGSADMSKPDGARFMIVGTFADKADECTGESLEDKNRRLVEALQAYENVHVNYNPAKGEVIVAVNAVVEEERDQEAARLRDIITKALEATGMLSQEVPLRWFVLELDISRIAAEKDQFVLLLSECVDAGKKLGMSEQEVKQALMFFNDYALYIYFPDVFPFLVFVNPQPLLNKLTELMVISFADRFDLVPVPSISLADYRRLKEEGIFSLALLRCLPTGFIRGVFEEEEFIKLLEYLLVVAPIKKEGMEAEYFLPCILPRQSLTNEQISNFVSRSDPWVISWETKPIPQGLFPAMVVHLLTRQEAPFFKPPLHKVCQLRNVVRMSTSLGGAILVVDSHRWLEIYYSGVTSVCPSVRKAVLDAISLAGQRLHYAHLLDSMQEGFLCYLCGESQHNPHPCFIHVLPNHQFQATCSIDEAINAPVSDGRLIAWLINTVGEFHYSACHSRSS